MEIEEHIRQRLEKDAENLSELEYFQLLYSNDLIDSLVEGSNAYYTKYLLDNYGKDYKKIILSKEAPASYPYLYVTRGISREDVLAYVGIRIYMALHKLPAIRLYWSTGGLYQLKINRILPINYFCLLAKVLHFPEKEKDKKKEEKETESTTTENELSSSNLTSESGVKIDPRHKINFYLQKLGENFQKFYELGQNITIDESLLLFKGRNSMKFYIPMKPHKWGFKIHCLCDSDTHYLYNMLFDPGKSGKDFIYLDDSSSISESIVLRLLSCVNDRKQRNLFCDGWYSSISLMKKLSNMGYLVTTVLRSGSKEIPSKLKLKGYDKAYNDEILIQKYEGKKTILFATNYDIEIEKLRNIYNIKNRGVDTFDHYLEISSIQRRTLKWYKKIIMFGIDASIINSKIICELKTGRSYTTVQFKEKIVQAIFSRYRNYKNYANEINTNSNNCLNLNSYYKNNLGISKNPTITNTCRIKTHNIGFVKHARKVCQRCNEGTSYYCIECNIGLHPECFIDYHDGFEVRGYRK